MAHGRCWKSYNEINKTLKPFEAHPGQQRLLHVYQSKRLKVCNPLRLNMTWSMRLNISARLLNCRVVVNNHTAPLLWCGFVPSLETFRMWLHKDLKPQQQQQEQQEPPYVCYAEVYCIKKWFSRSNIVETDEKGPPHGFSIKYEQPLQEPETEFAQFCTVTVKSSTWDIGLWLLFYGIDEVFTREFTKDCSTLQFCFGKQPMSPMFEVSKFRPLALTGRNWNGHVPLLRRTLDVWRGTEANNNATSWTHNEHMMKTWWRYDEKHGRYQDLNLCAPKLLQNLDAKWFKIFARSQHEISLEFLQSIFILLYLLHILKVWVRPL